MGWQVLEKNESLANRGGKVIPSRDELSQIATFDDSIAKNPMLDDLNQNIKNIKSTLGLPSADFLDAKISDN